MSKKKTRERQLAKFRAKLESQRRRRGRQRIAAGVVALALATAGTIVAVVAFTGEEPEPTATPTPTATATPSPTPSPTSEPLAVACGGQVPPETREDRRRDWRRMPELEIDLDARYLVTLETSCGSIEVRLLAREAPYTVNNFVWLANRGFYDGLVFHRIANVIDVIQVGDPTCLGRKPDLEVCPTDGTEGPGYTIPDETFNDLELDEGVLAMANTGAPDSGGSQFFIITGDRGEDLPPNYTVFGKVVRGRDVAQRIQKVAVGGSSGEVPQQLVYLERVTVSVLQGR